MTLSDYWSLIKPRPTLLALAAVMAGYFMASVGSLNYGLMFHAVFSSFWLGAGCNVWNQALEASWDSMMKRTENRAIPLKKISKKSALLIGSACAGFGVAYAWYWVNPLCATYQAVLFVIYVFAYTPLKRVSPHSLHLGAVSGALPPVIGWAAARESAGLEAWVLFGIIYLWQIPHFLAIAWIYRDEYRAGGFKVLTAVEEEGNITVRQGLIYSILLGFMAVCPFLLHMSGIGYLTVSILTSVFFIYACFKFSRNKTISAARAVVKSSVLYLTILFVVMAWDKLG
jgi:protoheme IX farnesyltransferase